VTELITVGPGSSSDVVLALVWCAVLVAVFTPIAVLRYRHA
jgi:hypothetical protein